MRRSTGSSSATTGGQLVDESEVGAGGLHRVEAARAGPLVLGRAAGRQAAAGQVTGQR